MNDEFVAGLNPDVIVHTQLLPHVFVPGLPQQQGSKNQFGGEDNKKLHPWRADIKSIIVGEIGWDYEPYRSGVHVSALFVFPRPQMHFRSNGDLKETAPVYVEKAPDLDKLQRAVGDALTGLVIYDDKLIVSWQSGKVFGTRPGLHLSVSLPPPVGSVP